MNPNCPFSSVDATGPPPRQSQRPLLHVLSDMPQFMALLDRQLGHCRRYGLRATVLLIGADLQAEGAQTLQVAEQQALLQAVGARLLGRVRGSDLVAQIGQRHFGLVLMDAGRAETEVVRARLHEALYGPYGVGDLRLYMSLRMGAAVYREAGMTGRELALAAEAAQRGATVPGGLGRQPLVVVKG